MPLLWLTHDIYRRWIGQPWAKGGPQAAGRPNRERRSLSLDIGTGHRAKELSMMWIPEPQNDVRELDPFGFWLGHCSAIRPLGGIERGPDPRYVFHTPYVEYRPGRVLFTIRFRQAPGDLRRVALLPSSTPSSRAAAPRRGVFVTSSRLDLTDRAAVERGLTISILSVAGQAMPRTASAWRGATRAPPSLTITAEQTETADDTNSEAFLLPTALGNAPLDMQARLVDDGAPRFCDPV